MAHETRSPLGDSFLQAWMRRITLVAETLGADQSTSSSTTSRFDFAESYLKQYAEQCGYFAILKAAIEITPVPGFDPCSYAFYQCPSMEIFVARWREIISQQTQTYFQMHDIALTTPINLDRQVALNNRTLYVAPLANGVPGGSAVRSLIFMGAIIGLMRLYGLEGLVCRQVLDNDVSRTIISDDQFLGSDIDPDAPWIMTWEDDRAMGHNPILAAQFGEFSFSNFLRKRPSSDSIKIARRVAAAAGSYPSLQEMAAALNLSNRTLSRRLATDGTTYKLLVRHSRLQAACTMLASGIHNLDDVAFVCDYSDRQYMTREFGQMAGMTPAAYRDVVGYL